MIYHYMKHLKLPQKAPASSSSLSTLLGLTHFHSFSLLPPCSPPTHTHPPTHPHMHTPTHAHTQPHTHPPPPFPKTHTHTHSYILSHAHPRRHASSRAQPHTRTHTFFLFSFFNCFQQGLRDAFLLNFEDCITNKCVYQFWLTFRTISRTCSELDGAEMVPQIPPQLKVVIHLGCSLSTQQRS